MHHEGHVRLKIWSFSFIYVNISRFVSLLCLGFLIWNSSYLFVHIQITHRPWQFSEDTEGQRSRATHSLSRIRDTCLFSNSLCCWYCWNDFRFFFLLLSHRNDDMCCVVICFLTLVLWLASFNLFIVLRHVVQLRFDFSFSVSQLFRRCLGWFVSGRDRSIFMSVSLFAGFSGFVSDWAELSRSVR